MSEELSDDACIALALLVGAKHYKEDHVPQHAFVCNNVCRKCEPRTWGYLGRETKGAAARLYCENHKLLATPVVTP